MLKYSQMLLDRASNLRKDEKWLAQQRTQNSHWLLLWQDKNLFYSGQTEAVLLDIAQVQDLGITDEALNNASFLGLQDQQAYFTIDLTYAAEDIVNRAMQLGEFHDVRKYGPELINSLASILIFARALCHWHRTHKYCGHCGTENVSASAGHSRCCSDSRCGREVFPRTDPAVIMLVEKTFSDGVERCLLGRQSQWPEGVYSTLAGFVDPAETLEQAVAREVMEESGIAVDNVRYISSQPWPFPSSIMLGFIAQAVDSDITVDKEELDDARWFSREDLACAGEWGDDGPGVKLSRPDSIARNIIDHWRGLKAN